MPTKLPVIRAQAPDDMAPSVRKMAAMPSPEQLGVGPRSADDWTAVHKRLQDLGVTTFQLDRLNPEVFAFTCLLPTADPGQTHRIEAHGATEVEAACRALDEAQRWCERRQ
jgi:hypothetical protein